MRYMEIPEGMAVQVNKEKYSYQRLFACHLIKFIYCQQQSPWAWYTKIHNFSHENNFTSDNQV